MKNTVQKKEINLSKKAFFILGPESSGTRMMTQAFIACGAYGCGGHGQKLDKEGFGGGHELIVFRRSIPHGQDMPPIIDIVKQMQENGYEVIPIIILRDKDKCAASQIQRHHASNMQEAKNNIRKAIVYAYQQLYQTNLDNIHIMYYEPFVNNKYIRDKFFKKFGFNHPNMDFYNANVKHR